MPQNFVTRKTKREVILTLVEKGLEPNLEAVRAEKSLAEALSKVNTINAAIEEIKKGEQLQFKNTMLKSFKN